MRSTDIFESQTDAIGGQVKQTSRSQEKCLNFRPSCLQVLAKSDCVSGVTSLHCGPEFGSGHNKDDISTSSEGCQVAGTESYGAFEPDLLRSSPFFRPIASPSESEKLHPPLHLSGPVGLSLSDTIIGDHRANPIVESRSNSQLRSFNPSASNVVRTGSTTSSSSQTSFGFSSLSSGSSGGTFLASRRSLQNRLSHPVCLTHSQSGSSQNSVGSLGSGSARLARLPSQLDFIDEARAYFDGTSDDAIVAEESGRVNQSELPRSPHSSDCSTTPVDIFKTLGTTSSSGSLLRSGDGTCVLPSSQHSKHGTGRSPGGAPPAAAHPSPPVVFNGAPPSFPQPRTSSSLSSRAKASMSCAVDFSMLSHNNVLPNFPVASSSSGLLPPQGPTQRFPTPPPTPEPTVFRFGAQFLEPGDESPSSFATLEPLARIWESSSQGGACVLGSTGTTGGGGGGERKRGRHKETAEKAASPQQPSSAAVTTTTTTSTTTTSAPAQEPLPPPASAALTLMAIPSSQSFDSVQVGLEREDPPTPTCTPFTSPNCSSADTSAASVPLPSAALDEVAEYTAIIQSGGGGGGDSSGAASRRWCSAQRVNSGAVSSEFMHGIIPPPATAAAATEVTSGQRVLWDRQLLNRQHSSSACDHQCNGVSPPLRSSSASLSSGCTSSRPAALTLGGLGWGHAGGSGRVDRSVEAAVDNHHHTYKASSTCIRRVPPSPSSDRYCTVSSGGDGRPPISHYKGQYHDSGTRPSSLSAQGVPKGHRQEVAGACDDLQQQQQQQEPQGKRGNGGDRAIKHSNGYTAQMVSGTGTYPAADSSMNEDSDAADGSTNDALARYPCRMEVAVAVDGDADNDNGNGNTATTGRQEDQDRNLSSFCFENCADAALVARFPCNPRESERRAAPTSSFYGEGIGGAALLANDQEFALRATPTPGHHDGAATEPPSSYGSYGEEASSDVHYSFWNLEDFSDGDEAFEVWHDDGYGGGDGGGAESEVADDGDDPASSIAFGSGGGGGEDGGDETCGTPTMGLLRGVAYLQVRDPAAYLARQSGLQRALSTVEDKTPGVPKLPQAAMTTVPEDAEVPWCVEDMTFSARRQASLRRNLMTTKGGARAPLWPLGGGGGPSASADGD